MTEPHVERALPVGIRWYLQDETSIRDLAYFETGVGMDLLEAIATPPSRIGASFFNRDEELHVAAVVPQARFRNDAELRRSPMDEGPGAIRMQEPLAVRSGGWIQLEAHPPRGLVAAETGNLVARRCKCRCVLTGDIFDAEVHLPLFLQTLLLIRPCARISWIRPDGVLMDRTAESDLSQRHTG